MRWLFIGLVVLNLAYLAIQWAKPSSSKAAVLTEQTTAALTETQRALWLGGFAELAEIENLSQRLMSLGIASALVEQQTSQGNVYLLYADNQQQAAVQQQLQQFKLADSSYPIMQGEALDDFKLSWQFDDQQQAVATQQQLNKAKLDKTFIQEMPVKQQEYWLEVDPASVRLLDTNMLQRLKNDYPQLQIGHPDK